MTQRSRQVLLITAAMIDALGSGVWVPFSLIFFTRGQGVPLTTAGTALTVGALAGLVVGYRSGHLVDRRGAGFAAVLSNVLRTGSYCLYPLVHSTWQLMLVVCVTAAADRMYWTANAPMIGTLFRGRQLDRFLSLAAVARVLGLGAGAGLAGFLAGTATGLRSLAVLNGLSFAVAAILITLALGRLMFRVPAPAPGRAEAAVSVWRDRPYLVLCGIQVLYVLAGSTFVLILPVVVLDVMDGPLWLPGAAIVAGNLVLALAQAPVLRWVGRVPRARFLILAVFFYAAGLLLMTPAAGIGPDLVVPVVLAAAVLGAVGEAFCFPLMIAAADEVAPDGQKGRYSGLFQTAWGLADVCGPLLYTTLLAVSNALLWGTVAVVVLTALPAVLWLRHRLPARVLAEAAA
ncbi:MFS transporter [Actinoplanes utahensis]|uniref:Major facilitator superfamily (MFS) profile domain-containing protein n=1 Tax=Actinoplanes utahensis TaxID=1869 RepID=A0A0A6UMI4_ACTUT|nr:MFS transporter [Actinoplanes utahensis]KHD76646.1 hypothetical protein MB27_15190 [Actinoplanes utahensis]GIF33313.1 MFS transporter [Actinoplanes utahensis]